MCFPKQFRMINLAIIVCFSTTILFGCEAIQEAHKRKQVRIIKEMMAQVKPREHVSKRSTFIGQAAPDFTLTDLNGKSVTLSSLKGKAVLLNFWATW